MRIAKAATSVLLSVIFAFQIQATNTITLEGTYQGEGIYVQNPYNSANQSFCVQEVKINGEVKSGDKGFTIKQSAFEIPLKDFEKGEYVNIKITHKDDCQPKILNSESLRSKSTFKVVSMEVTKEKVKFTTKNEHNEEPIYVERYQNNKWVVVGKVIGKGAGGYNNYSVNVTHFSGVNKYRLKQHSTGGVDRYSEIKKYKSDKEPVEFYPKRVSDKLHFSRQASYEIYDSFGYLIKKGEGKTIDVSGLEKGVYYVNVDNRTEKFLKK